MFPRSFRSRLTSFFLIIVILPMVVVAVVLFRLVADSEQGKADAQLAQAQRSAAELYRTTQGRAADAGQALSESPRLAAALERGDRPAIEAQLARPPVVYALLERPGGTRIETGDDTAIGMAPTRLVDRAGDAAGALTVGVRSAQDFADEVKRLTALDVLVAREGDVVADTLDTLPAVPADLPTRGDRVIAGREFRITSFTAEGTGGPLTIRLLGDAAVRDDATFEDRILIGLLLLGFLLLALALALAVSRQLQGQIQNLLRAARRLGTGELDTQVPTEGNDEFAALGSEFNAMARQLQGRLDELGAERERLRLALRRVGESLATGLNRDALLGIVVQTAVDGVAAATGRASVRDAPSAPLVVRAELGSPADFADIIGDAERAVLQTGEPAEVTRHGQHALSHPLRPSEGGDRVVGLVSVARAGRPFTAADRDLFHYLAGQAAVSIKNVDLHESVQRQAVTDELTGLFNHRRFQEVMASEVERAKRFGDPLGLIMLDIDDFKGINDVYGHLVGDEVLREVARVVLDTSREIDEPARYGGEEIAVVLPQTDLEGAALFGERLRSRIEGLEVPILHGEGTVRVTASVGAAALSNPALADKDVLVQAADSALYRAKRLGKNRVVRAS